MIAMMLFAGAAEASEVATSKMFGIGVASGPNAIDFTLKYWFNEKMGISGYAGTSIVYHAVRVNFESEIVKFAEWSFAGFDMYWDAGVDVGYWFYGAPVVGVGGGVGVELKFNSVPAHVFADVGLQVNPINPCGGYGGYYNGLCYVSPRVAAGGRWYF